ncbi:MAG: glycosyltransferase family 39 protein [bacterium]|nr:glycosyltransferase family 39 protein [bacterium]
MKKLALLLTILIIASFLRLYNLTDLPPGLYPDEAMNGNNALEARATGHWKVFYPENNGREGLFINIQGLFLAVLGNQPWALRLPSAIFGILTVLGIYFLTKELFQEWPKKDLGFKMSRAEKLALLAAFFIAVSFWHINFSRIGFRAIMAPLLLTWGIYLLIRAFRKPHWFAPIIAGFIYGLGLHTYIAYRATPLLIVICFWLMVRKYGWEPVLRIGFIFTVIAFLTFLPLGLYFWENPAEFFGRTTQVSVFNSPAPLKNLGENILKTAGMFNFSGDWNWRHNIAGRPLLFWPVGILFLVSIFYGVYLVFRGFIISNLRSLISKQIPNPDNNNRQNFIILLAWLVIAGLPVIVSNEGLPHALRAILMAPPVFIIAAFGGISAYEFLKQHWSRSSSVIGCLFVAVLVVESFYSYFITWGKNPNVQGAFSADYIQIGRTLNSLPKELPKYVVIQAGGGLVRGIPMPSQTVMFITDSFTSEKQKTKNITYLLPGQENQIPANEKNYIAYIK